MTSTPFTVGLNEGKRLSSRVLRPPGGGHTDIFGGEPDPTHIKIATPPPVLEQEESQNSNNGLESSNGNGPTIPETIQEDQLKTTTNKPSNDNVEKKTENVVVEAPVQNETQKRGRVPPGGFSQPLW